MATVYSGFLSTLVQSSFGIKGATVIVSLVVTVAVTISVYFTDRPYDGFPMFGKDGTKIDLVAKYRWLTSAKKIMREGMQKAKGPFQVVANCGPLILLPPTMMEEIRNDDRMTFKAWLKQHFFTTYPGFQGFAPAVENDVFVSSVKVGLTQTLGRATEVLSAETDDILKELYPYNEEWKETTFDKDATNIIARLSTCIFMPGLAHNEEWLKIAVDYTVDFFTGAYILRMIPPILRPIVHWVLLPTRKLRKDIKIAQRLIDSELAARKRKQEEHRKAGRPVELPVDALQWVETVSHNKGLHCDPVYAQLNYTLGAVHTTSITFVNAVCDLIAHPEYVELLREEVNTVYAANGNQWNKTSVSQLQLMDSFIKESARLSPVTMLPINRVAEETFTLSNGTTIPKGATVGVPTLRATDPSVFPDPYKFDGHRFFNLRNEPGGASKYQFVSTSNDMIIFGHGKHACPGRFFAANEIKILLSKLLLGYDLKFPDDQLDRLRPLEVGADTIPNPSLRIWIRSRKQGQTSTPAVTVESK